MRYGLHLLVLVVLGSVLLPSARSEDEARPATQAAREVARAWLEALAAERFEEAAASCWDAESVLRRLFPGEWDALRDIERREMVGVMGTALAQHAKRIRRDLTWSDGALGAASVEASPPPEDLVTIRIAVRPTRESGGAPGELRLLLAPHEDGHLIVDAGLASDPWMTRRLRELYDALGQGDPLSFVWTMSGKRPPPGSAATAPPLPPAPEWASRDALGLGIAPPLVHDAPRDEPHPGRGKGPWGARIAVHLDAEGALHVRRDGRRDVLHRIDLATPDPRAQTLALREVEALLRLAASMGREPEEDGVSPVRLLVHADAHAKSRYVHWLLALCREQGVGIRHVDLVVARGEPGQWGVLRIDLDAPEGEATRPRLELRAFRRELDHPELAYTHLKVGDRAFDLPREGWHDEPRTPEVAAARKAVLAELRSAVGALREASPGLAASVATPPPRGPHVPYEDVVDLLWILRQEDVPAVELVGAPLPWTPDDLEDVEEEQG